MKKKEINKSVKYFLRYGQMVYFIRKKKKKRSPHVDVW